MASVSGRHLSGPPRLHLHLPLDAARLLRARERVRDYLRSLALGEDAIDEVVLSIEEACTNSIRHSGADDGVDISMICRGEDIVADIEDHGRGFDLGVFDPTSLPDPTALGGRGLFLMAQLMDEMEVDAGDGVHVHLVKHIGDQVREGPGDQSSVPHAFPDGEPEDRVKVLLDEIDEAFIAIDWEYRIVHMNTAALRMASLPADEIVGRLQDVLPIESGSQLDRALKDAMEFGVSRVVEWQSPLNGGWEEVRLYPTPFGVSGYARGIEERKQAEIAGRQAARDLRRSQARLQATFEQVGVGMLEVELDGRIEHVNERAAQLLGYARWELEKLTLPDVTHPADILRQRRHIEALVGGISRSFTFEMRCLRKDGGAAWTSATFTVVPDETGLPGYLVVVLQDISSQKLAEALARELREISASITSLLDRDAILRRVVRQAVEAMGAESGAISLLQDDAWLPRYLHNLPASLHEPIARESVGYAEEAVRNRHPVAVDDCGTDPRVDGELQGLWEVLSVLVAPLVVRDEVVGGLFFNFHSHTHSFTSIEIEFAANVANMVSSALRAAGEFQAERELATTLQNTFIHPLPEVSGLELVVVAEAAQAPRLIGGDFSDVFVLEDGRVVITVGDVEGKGVDAAGLTETVRTAVRSLALVDPSPAFILQKADELVRREPADQFVTVIVIVLDPVTGEGSYASAGHLMPLLVAGPTCDELPGTPGTPLGSVPIPHEERSLTIGLAETLILYTDGLVEVRRDGEQFGHARLCRAAVQHRAAPLADFTAGLLAAARDFGALTDDVEILALRRRG